MRIALIEPYYGGSHKYWADRLYDLSEHSIDLYTMPARYWKWRMQGSAFHISAQINAKDIHYDLFLVSDMIDLALFRSLLTHKTPCILYMHENQLCYPFSSRDKQKDQELGYGFLNYKSCLSADKILFNSQYHLKVFLEACKALLLKMPDYNTLESLDIILNKASVMPIGLDLATLNSESENKLLKSEIPVILWNHRWDEDKNPAFFKKFLDELHANNDEFRLILTKQSPHENEIFEALVSKYEDRILHAEYCESFSDYVRLLQSSDYVFVSPGHDFFGISVLEAVYCGACPLLPKSRVYSEHFNESEFPELYYSDLNEIRSIFLKALHKDKPLKIRLKSLIEGYNWKALIKRYDNYLSELGN